MGPSYVTIIASLAGDTTEALKSYLRANANPGPPAAEGEVLRCQREFRFDCVPTLHFCSLLVLEEDVEAGIPAELIFEATFDGTIEAFLHDLLIAAPSGLHQAFTHCQGYPLAGAPSIGDGFTIEQRAAVHAYLLARDVGAHAYFSGSPGRTVQQIGQEQRLRTALRDDLARRRLQTRPMPPTNLALHASLKQVVATDPSLAFARNRIEPPWQVRHRDRVARVAIAIGYVVLAGISALLLAAFGAAPERVFAALALARQPLLLGAVVLGIAWLGVRAWELRVTFDSADPQAQSGISDGLTIGLSLLRVAVISLLAALALLALAAVLDPGADILSGAIAAEAAGLRYFFGFDDTRNWWATVAWLVVVLLVFAAMQWSKTTLELARARAPSAFPYKGQLSIAIGNGVKVTLQVVAAMLVLRHLAGWLAPCTPFIRGLAAVAICAAVALAFTIMLMTLALALIRLHERRDRHAFRCAETLLRAPLDNEIARAREERGINTAQNHLVSVTYVKPGYFRLLLLRATLWAIDLLARYWFNRGRLGEIPTILSARWVVIDKGRRLIFLDNYGGGWESYLNEFIDMGAVKGLNAIWCNTYIKWRAPGASGPLEKVAFPETRYATTRGAQAERPFKRYARLSQVETLAWYSAYHTLSITGIDASTKVRNALFEPLDSHKVDELVSYL